LTFTVLIAFLFTAILCKLIYIEVIDSGRLQSLALDQWTRDVPLRAERGKIYDRNGVVLADSTTSYTIFVRPVSVKNKEHTAKVLSSVLGLDEIKLLEKMRSKISEITVAKQVDKQTMLKITKEKVTGVYFSQNIKRVYPYGDFLSQVLGFVNIDGQGQAGLENYYNRYLSGKDGAILTQTDLVGRQLADNYTLYNTGIAGSSIKLTIDYVMQSIAENAVKNAYERFTPLSSSCIIMNPKSGEIYAMAQRPSINLNNIPRDDIPRLFANSKSILVSNVFEPGSTFKILTTALALEYGVINRDYNFFCPGYKIVDGKKIKCWRTRGHGSQTFDEGVQHSCNVLFMEMALRLGVDRFYEGIDKFNLQRKTGIDMSGEASGLILSKDIVKNVDLARMGFGQAIAVTPLELLTAASAAINGGVIVKPYLLKSVEDSFGNTVQTFSSKPGERIISENTSALMRDILEKAVSLGSGKNASVAGYKIGGKTGTAQKYENGIIASGKYVSTFIGFAPADDPEYIVLMAVDEPKGGMYYGSIVAAPYVKDIFANIFEYIGIEPANKTPVKSFAMPALKGLSYSKAKAELYKLGLYHETVGEGGTVISQIPVEGAWIDENTVVLIDLGE
jgi:stage V sporulation protein D (sporulation-specific penicillin-binding protein)